MRFFKTVVVLLIILCTACAQTNQQSKNESDTAKEIDELVTQFSDYEGFNGAILVAHEGEIIYKKGFGYANMEWEIPNTTTTKFRIASVTKPFTAMLIMQLVAEQKLQLHEPIAIYIPDYPTPYGNQITIHHLLTHSSGIPNNYKSDKRLNQFPGKKRLTTNVAEFWNVPLEFSPGARFQYSNAGYAVLGLIIEKVTGKSYETVLNEQILSPLSMNNTGIEKHRPLLQQRASGYFKGFGNYYNANYIDLSGITAVGNMYATVEDLFLLDKALYDNTLLSESYREIMFNSHIKDPDFGHYGYGWELIDKPIGNTAKTVKTIGHSGAIDGFCALYTRIPETKSVIILLNNTRRAYLNAMTTAITGILYNETYDVPKKPLAKFMAQRFEKEGVDKAISFYKSHKDDPAYYIDESELIIEGYRLLHANNAEEAAKVFKLSTEVFPDKDNPYDSYAEALLALGNTKEAIINYKKSIAINPNNHNAKRVLKSLE